MASALTCDEPTEDRRIREEKVFYYEFKNYLDVCNAIATNQQENLEIVASGFELTRNDFVFVIYTKNWWQNYVADGMCNYVEEKYKEM